MLEQTNILNSSVTEAKENPYYTLMEEDNEGFLQKSKEATFTRRQDCPSVWNVNGSIYIFPKKEFIEGGFDTLSKRKFVMNALASIDLDSPSDWTIAESLFKAGISVY